MKMDETEYTELYMELEKYEKRGIDMLLDGYQASPLQIVTAHMVKEAGTYMRDYTMSGDGNIELLDLLILMNTFGQKLPLNAGQSGGCVKKDV